MKLIFHNLTSVPQYQIDTYKENATDKFNYIWPSDFYATATVASQI